MIKEIIIVEGKDDITRVKEAVDADVIATHGIHISKNKLKEIVELSANRGAIILTDPDHPGEIIRKKLKKILKCEIKDAYINQKDAILNGDVGIENVDKEIIKNAIFNARPNLMNKEEIFDYEFLLKNGLTGESNSAKLREELGKILKIGKTNAKELLNRLNSFGIKKEEVLKILEEIKSREEH